MITMQRGSRTYLSALDGSEWPALRAISVIAPITVFCT